MQLAEQGGCLGPHIDMLIAERTNQEISCGFIPLSLDLIAQCSNCSISACSEPAASRKASGARAPTKASPQLAKPSCIELLLGLIRTPRSASTASAPSAAIAPTADP